MNNFSMMKAELEERSFGSSFDPLLNGVALGLAKLFPPIENAHRPEAEDEAGPLHEADDEHADE